MKKSLLLLLAALVFPACSTPPPAPSIPNSSSTSISSPSKEWMDHASRIKTEKFVIYYEDGARGTYTPDRKEWHGMIPGVAVIVQQSDGNRVIIPKDSKAYLGSNGTVDIMGPSLSVVHDNNSASR